MDNCGKRANIVREPATRLVRRIAGCSPDRSNGKVDHILWWLTCFFLLVVDSNRDG